ncbi:terminase [Pimelobacter simplex]|uniref:terminase n=1 Tax=Nocardioides simplex TaxID=2045 RepID=UPI002150514B|nr:terminase [Pimelobacter simplex]UUW88390.1 terminase [Pimelobacter simplex]UUW97894.1 terminase [Pimelobacter simplex]
MQQRDQVWLPNPPDGTAVCGGFDGSLNNDWTCIKLETREGLLFTPRYGPDRRPAIWNPAMWPDHQIPRGEVDEAWDEINRRYRLLRVYYDPGFHDEDDWTTEGEAWDEKHGPDVFLPWPTNQIGRMYPALRRFEADLRNRAITQDGCPITTTHVGNARKLAKGERYILGKPSQEQKIDAGVTSVICHEAAADMRAAGWPDAELPPLVFGM